MVLLLLRSPIVKHLHTSWLPCVSRNYSTKTTFKQGEQVTVAGKAYQADHMTNVTPHLLSHVGKDLHLQKYHPLNHTCQRIVQYMYKRYVSLRGNPLFSVHNQIHPVVTTHQNFDSLLIPKDHVSRKKSDNYYVNERHLLRAHTSAHQSELIGMGFDNFLVIGDVYRRDEIDASHYPVFHQVEGVRLCTASQIFGSHQNMDNFQIFDSGERTTEKQGVHTAEALHLLESDLKGCLLGLATSLFGQDIEARWVDAYFPFTHPSWELEVKLNDVWVELLGCGLIEQEILFNRGVEDKIGWAFGLGLERWAMKLFGIPDIRLFWSTDSGFLSQFHFDDPTKPVKYKTVSKYMQCSNDISFWLPADGQYNSTDFFDLVRTVGGDTVEQVHLIDAFTHQKKKLTSHCYRIVYRHMEKVLTQEEVNILHRRIEEEAAANLNVTIR
ncbi:phenylalanine--tRNA ligase, mitochondrial-like [Homarus americanus]|uniref:phenylalanine--tRNA ligase, mitochondrial-like n=1 Tax=Homarus americanus TaxID=6706 RepID=UPI001C449A68|nr:phenylalanine--tRNA ligase, mitochondrial-like [Homarus americanus]XP_042237754.1 phenylalanine--tRNA ligase, mitochondrial-like [Homarus americanus]